MKDPYLYEDVAIMKNKLGIKNPDKLENAENAITLNTLSTLSDLEDGKFDFEKLKEIHRHIFGDIYEWAGKPRIMNIEKSERVLHGLSVQYCDFKSIEKEAKKVISEINKVDWKSLDIDKTAKEFSRLMAKLWQVHPFREGNTRTVVSFMQSFGKSKGIEIDKELLKYNAGYVRSSLVLASIGEYSEYQHLNRIIKDSIIELKSDKDLSLKEKKINKDDEFRKEYLEQQKRKSLAKKKDLDIER